MERRRLRTLLAGLVAMLVAGCGNGDEPAATPSPEAVAPPVACTRASCLGGVDIRLRAVPARGASVEACVDGHCEVFRAPVPRSVRVSLPAEGRSGGPSSRVAEVTAEALDRDGVALAAGSSRVRLEALRPNGRRCTPTCWSGGTTVTLRRRNS